MSDSNDWYLRHRDGVEHGPFQLADLIAAARAGNIASDTVLKHEVHSRNQWVFATRVQPVAEAMAGNNTTPSAPPASTAAQPQRKRVAPATAAAQPAPSPAAKPPVQKPSEQPREPPAPERVIEAPKPSTSSSLSEVAASVPSVQPTRRSTISSHAFPVPKTFVEALLTLFDFRFQRFVTPWIIQLTWVLAVVFAICAVTGLAYMNLIQPNVEVPTEAPSPDRGSWEFDPLAGQSLWNSGFFRFGVGLFWLGSILLATRVACEGAIVFFRVAIDVRELKVAMRERDKDPID